MVHRTWLGTVVAALVFASPAAAQLCLGRSLPGEATVSLDVGIATDVGSRIAAGNQLDGGLGWRVGMLGTGDTGPASLDLETLHGELTWSLPLGASASACPGAAVYRTVLGDDEPVTVVDLFASFATRLTPGRRVELVPFVTPRLVIGPDRAYQNELTANDIFPSYDPGIYSAPQSATLAALTGGFGVLFGPFGLQASLSAATPVDGLQTPAFLLGFGLTYRLSR